MLGLQQGGIKKKKTKGKKKAQAADSDIESDSEEIQQADRYIILSFLIQRVH